jgi:hypothetical protein
MDAEKASSGAIVPQSGVSPGAIWPDPQGPDDRQDRTGRPSMLHVLHTRYTRHESVEDGRRRHVSGPRRRVRADGSRPGAINHRAQTDRPGSARRDVHPSRVGSESGGKAGPTRPLVHGPVETVVHRRRDLAESGPIRPPDGRRLTPEGAAACPGRSRMDRGEGVVLRPSRAGRVLRDSSRSRPGWIKVLGEDSGWSRPSLRGSR